MIIVVQVVSQVSTPFLKGGLNSIFQSMGAMSFEWKCYSRYVFYYYPLISPTKILGACFSKPVSWAKQEIGSYRQI
jgi:hypothetical protein